MVEKTLNDLLHDTLKDKQSARRGSPAGGQAVEHYEMSRYGVLKGLGHTARHEECRDAPRQTLQEEEKANALLSKLAEAKVNLKPA